MGGSITSTFHLSLHEDSRSHSMEISVPLPFPKNGVRLSSFHEFVEACGGMDNLQGLTTADVCARFVMPMTRSLRCSYCDLLDKTSHAAVGTATVFVSHAWQYLFLEVVETLQGYFMDNPDVVVWLDLFSHNQHKATQSHFPWWCESFKSAIGQFGHTVMVLSSWQDPIPLRRTWCLYEVYCSAEQTARFDIALPKGQREQLIIDIGAKGIEGIHGLLGAINVVKSETREATDHERLLDVINATVGANKLNMLVSKEIRKWLVEVTRPALEAIEGDRSATYGLETALVRVYCDLGAFDEADRLQKIIVERKLLLEGNQNIETLSAQLTWADVKRQNGKNEEAKAVLTACLEACNASLSSEHPLVADCKIALADVLVDMSQYSQAEPLLKSMLDMYNRKGQEDSPKSLSAMAIWISCLRGLGREEEAEGTRQHALQIYRKKLEKGEVSRDTFYLDRLVYFNPDSCAKVDWENAEEDYAQLTNRKMTIVDDKSEAIGPGGSAAGIAGQAEVNNDNGVTMSTMMSATTRKEGSSDGDEKEAQEKMLQDTLLHRKEDMGDSHPSTLEAMDALAFFYQDAERWGEAADLRRQCWKLREETLGSDQMETVLTCFGLAETLTHQALWAEAAQLMESCVAGFRKIEGDDSSLAQNCLFSLIDVLVEIGEIPKARLLFHEWLGHKSTYDDQTMRRIMGFIGTQYERGEKEEAVAFLQTAKSHAPDRCSQISLTVLLADLYLELDDAVKAQQILRDCIEEGYDNNFPPLPMLKAMAKLANLLVQKGEHQEAIVFLERCQFFLLVFPGGSPDEAFELDVKNALGCTYFIAGQNEKALPLLQEVHKAFVEKFGPDSDEVSRLLTILNCIQGKHGESRGAEEVGGHIISGLHGRGRGSPSCIIC
eukprot:gene6268-6909_t